MLTGPPTSEPPAVTVLVRCRALESKSRLLEGASLLAEPTRWRLSSWFMRSVAAASSVSCTLPSSSAAAMSGSSERALPPPPPSPPAPSEPRVEFMRSAWLLFFLARALAFWALEASSSSVPEMRSTCRSAMPRSCTISWATCSGSSFARWYSNSTSHTLPSSGTFSLSCIFSSVPMALGSASTTCAGPVTSPGPHPCTPVSGAPPLPSVAWWAHRSVMISSGGLELWPPAAGARKPWLGRACSGIARWPTESRITCLPSLGCCESVPA
mmetsp:Transcript_25378/g.40080  ORF Transcript_25378/g.40080 Transcript_25378/m.40080 type:complete len:269 (+) Transcript_25378:1060-1866(+)